MVWFDASLIMRTNLSGCNVDTSALLADTIWCKAGSFTLRAPVYVAATCFCSVEDSRTLAALDLGYLYTIVQVAKRLPLRQSAWVALGVLHVVQS